MPVRYTIDPTLGLVHTVFEGDVTDDDLSEHLRTLREDPRYNGRMSELIDLRGVTAAEVSGAGMQIIARSLVHDPRARRAFIAPTDFTFGMSRMYQLLREGLGTDQLQVFRSLGDALAWLGLDANTAITG